MRLLQRDDAGIFSLHPVLTPNGIPPYAILSHTWGPEEVVFTDVEGTSNDWQRKAGYNKIKFCADQAKRDRLRYSWVDTCCIDKSDSIELQTAINSMFRWYRDAKRCYVYLSDVSSISSSGQLHDLTIWEKEFRCSRWFTRGWTLQELIAPKTVDFFSKEGVWLGDKRSLEPLIRDITGIPVVALRGTPVTDFPILEREAWARNRQTKYEEDMAYCLLGIFDIHMPLIYGEGYKKALSRLRKQVYEAKRGIQANEFSITFSLSEVPETQHFIAREKEIAGIHRRLSSDGSRRVVILHSLGGIGKTQIAIAYSKRYRDEYSAIFWLNAKDKAAIRQSFTSMAMQIRQQYPDASGFNASDLQQNHEELINAVRAWLSSPGNTRWLMVCDNYDNPSLPGRINQESIDIYRFFPIAYQGSIIITTRSSQVDMGHQIRIRKLESTEDSLKVLSTTSGRDGLQDDIDAQKLVQELDGLPLALATAGAYLRRVAIDLGEYLRLYEKSWARLHTSTPRLGSYDDRTLCSTWQLSYEQVQRHNPLAAHLLQWWAYFDNEDIWFELLQAGNKKDSPEWMFELADELKFNDAMGTLHDYGFVEPHASSPAQIESRGYSIHGCLHSWTIHVLNQDRDENLSRLAVGCIASRVPSQNEFQFWYLQRRLLPHAIIAYATLQDSDEGLDRAFHRLGLLHADQGKLQEAEEIYLRALRGKEKAWGLDHTSTLDTVNNLGILYAGQGKMQEAEEMYLRALQGKEKAWGPDHISTLDTVNNLGLLYKDQGKMQEAEEMYLRALQGWEKAWGPDHPSTLSTVNNLGILYKDQDKIQEAEEIYLRALRGKEKAWGPDHTSTLDTVNNLGNLYAGQGKLQEAEEMYLRALQGREKAWGLDHTSTLNTVNNLGNLYADQGKLQEAEEMYLRALRGYEKAMQTQSITRYRPAINTIWNLGALRWRQDRLLEAREYYQRAHSNLEKLLASSHADVRSLQDILLVLDGAINAQCQISLRI